MSIRTFFKPQCGARNPDAPNTCTKPHTQAGHVDGMHVDGTGVQLRGWIDDRSVHEAIGMDSPAAEADEGWAR